MSYWKSIAVVAAFGVLIGSLWVLSQGDLDHRPQSGGTPPRSGTGVFPDSVEHKASASPASGTEASTQPKLVPKGPQLPDAVVQRLTVRYQQLLDTEKRARENVKAITGKDPDMKEVMESKLK